MGSLACFDNYVKLIFEKRFFFELDGSKNEYRANKRPDAKLR